jgi:hypothetical protein
VEGRLANATFTSDGRLVTTGEVDRALALVLGARDYALEQPSPNTYRLRLVAPVEPTRAKAEARAALEGLYGPGSEVDVEIQGDLEPGPSGKYRRTAALFDFDEKGLFA